MTPPFGSALNDPNVRAAMRGVAEAGQRQSAALFTVHNALNGGELSPAMSARFDQPRYQTGCEKLLNMVPMPQGGITKRPGLVHCGAAGREDESAKARLIPFVFSAGESRILEFYGGEGSVFMRVWLPNGEPVMGNDNAPFTLTLPLWEEPEIAGMAYAQSADVLFLAHEKRAPGKISRYADNDWRYEEIDWMPSIAAPSVVAIRAVGEIPSGENSRTNYSYAVTAIDEATGEESLPSAAATLWNAAPLSQAYYVEITVSAAPGASEYRVYKKKGGVYGYIGRIVPKDIEGGGGTGGGVEPLVFEDRNIGADTEDTPPNARNPFDGPGEYPSVVFLHQQRLGYAASLNRPLTVWLSQSGNFESMAASIPPADDDAIEATLAATQANRILWCQSDRNGLALGTEGGEWVLSGTEGAALTPSDLSFQPQTFHGSQPGLPVLRAGNSLLYMQRGGRVAREFGYSFSADRYESGDLSLLARHILRGNPVVSWAWQAEPYNIVWCVLSDGTMAGLTYMREHDVVGWHRHDTAGFVEDVAAIPGADGNHQVWFVVRRNGRRVIERLAPFFEGGDPADAAHTDGADHVAFSGRCVPALPETTLQNGTTFLRVRKINAVKCRVLNSGPFKARVGESEALPVPVRGAEYAVLADWAVPLGAGWRDGDRLELIFDGPDPVTVLGIVTTVEPAELAGNQK